MVRQRLGSIQTPVLESIATFSCRRFGSTASAARSSTRWCGVTRASCRILSSWSTRRSPDDRGTLLAATPCGPTSGCSSRSPSWSSRRMWSSVSTTPTMKSIWRPRWAAALFRLPATRGDFTEPRYGPVQVLSPHCDLRRERIRQTATPRHGWSRSPTTGKQRSAWRAPRIKAIRTAGAR